MVSPQTLGSADWVNISHDNCSGLDKISRQTHPAPKQQRTHSTPILDSSDTTLPNKKVVMMREILTESCRSISDPDLTSNSDKERCSVSSGDADQENTEIQSSMDQIREDRVRKPKPLYNVRYSDTSLERLEVKRILEGLGNLSDAILLPGQRPNGTATNLKRKGAKSKIKQKPNKEMQRVKKSSKAFQSSDNIIAQEQPGTEKDGRRSSSGSPQEIRSPVPKKKNGTGIFKPWKKKLSIPIRPSPSPLEDPFGRDSPSSSSPPLQIGTGTGSVSEGDHVSTAGSLLSGEGEEPSPTHHVVSNPVHTEEERLEPNANFNLETLVQPVNKNWVKCGYLWLRMKLPNSRYAWTHIVSGCSYPCPASWPVYDSLVIT